MQTNMGLLTNNLDFLPDELVMNIINRLPLPELINFARTCKKLYFLCKETFEDQYYFKFGLENCLFEQTLIIDGKLSIKECRRIVLLSKRIHSEIFPPESPQKWVSISEFDNLLNQENIKIPLDVKSVLPQLIAGLDREGRSGPTLLNAFRPKIINNVLQPRQDQLYLTPQEYYTCRVLIADKTGVLTFEQLRQLYVKWGKLNFEFYPYIIYSFMLGYGLVTLYKKPDMFQLMSKMDQGTATHFSDFCRYHLTYLLIENMIGLVELASLLNSPHLSWLSILSNVEALSFGTRQYSKFNEKYSDVQRKYDVLTPISLDRQQAVINGQLNFSDLLLTEENLRKKCSQFPQDCTHNIYYLRRKASM